MTQGKLEALAWRSLPKTGNATLTTDPSMKARLEPRMQAASVARGCAEGIRVCSWASDPRDEAQNVDVTLRPEAVCQMGRGMSDAQHLIQMANDIGNFFRANPVREDAVAGIANHIKSFWTRRMREKLLADLKLHGDGSLDELPLEAVRRLEASPEVKPEDSPGGDAG
jgi:formate dehydrogenase subunit delta